MTVAAGEPCLCGRPAEVEVRLKSNNDEPEYVQRVCEDRGGAFSRFWTKHDPGRASVKSIPQ